MEEAVVLEDEQGPQLGGDARSEDALASAWLFRRAERQGHQVGDEGRPG